jgi:hypothetical protein
MGVPTWNDGDVLDAIDVNDWFVPRTARKPSDQQSGNTTLIDDADLQLQVDANAAYKWDVLLQCTGASIGTGDVKVTFTWPSGATAMWYGDGFAASTGSPGPSVTHVETASGTAHAFGIDGSGLSPVRITGRIATSSTAGTLKMRFAQNTSSGTVTKVLAGSSMEVWRTG